MCKYPADISSKQEPYGIVGKEQVRGNHAEEVLEHNDENFESLGISKKTIIILLIPSRDHAQGR
jgi:hypothetical protein